MYYESRGSGDSQLWLTGVESSDMTLLHGWSKEGQWIHVDWESIMDYGWHQDVFVHVGSQTLVCRSHANTQNVGCGKMQASAISDGSMQGQVAAAWHFSHPGSVTDPFIIKFLHTASYYNTELDRTGCATNHIEREKKLFISIRRCILMATPHKPRETRRGFSSSTTMCVNSSDCLNYSSSSLDFSAAYFHWQQWTSVKFNIPLWVSNSILFSPVLFDSGFVREALLNLGPQSKGTERLTGSC